MTLFCLLVSIFCQVQVPAETYRVFTENGKTGLRNQAGDVVIPPAYDALGWSDGDFSMVGQTTGYKDRGKWGLIQLNNKPVTKPLFSGLQPSGGRLIIAYKPTATVRHLAGCLDADGKEVIPFQYDGIAFDNMRAVVFRKTGDRFEYGLIDTDNKVLIPVAYQQIRAVGSLRYAVQQFDNKYALFADTGKPLTPFVYDHVSAFVRDRAVVTQNHQKGIVGRDGIIQVTPQYVDIQLAADGKATGRKTNSWFVLDGNNQVLLQLEADSIVMLNNNLFALRRGGNFSLVNAQFTPIHTREYSSIEPFRQNKAIVRQGDRYGMISSNGATLINEQYLALVQDKHYVLASTKPNQWVLLDSVGSQKTPRSYEHIERFNGIYFAVKNHAYFGAINAEGREIVSCVYDSILQYHDGKLAVRFRGAYGVINLKEEWLVSPAPGKVTIVSNDRYVREGDHTNQLRSFDGNVIYFTNNRLIPNGDQLEERISNGGKWIIDLDGRIVNRIMPPADGVEEIFPASEGLRGIRKNGRYGFVDDQGRLRIANRYEGIKPFSERLAAIRILNKWGFIDHDEKIAIQPVYEDVAPFSDGVSIVMQKGLYGAIDRRGLLLLPVRYERIEMLPTHRFLLHQQGMQGLADAKGQIIFAPRYEYLKDLNNGYVIIGRNDKYGLVTLKGISTIPMVYDAIFYDASNDRYLGLKKGAWEPVD